MKPLLLQFAEQPEKEAIDLSEIEYCSRLHLNVIKGTNVPAVSFLDVSTRTKNKASSKGSDTDQSLRPNTQLMVDTSTQTRTKNEASDTDHNPAILALMDTLTKTFTATESTDSDERHRSIASLLETRTFTKTTETGDSDINPHS